jgi:hypothetical protein
MSLWRGVCGVEHTRFKPFLNLIDGHSNSSSMIAGKVELGICHVFFLRLQYPATAEKTSEQKPVWHQEKTEQGGNVLGTMKGY